MSNPPQRGTSPALFDWYAGSVHVGEREAVEVIATALADEAPVLDRGLRQYSHGWQVRRGGRTVATVFAGGQNPDPFVQATSGDAPELARVLRSVGVPHSVARADVRVDVPAPDAYERLVGELVQVAKESRVQLLGVGDLWREDAGRPTVYAGSPKSPTRVRIYDKATESGMGAGATLWRVEVQHRPDKPAAKAEASTLPEADFFGRARWCREFATRALSLEAAPAAPRTERVSDLEGALTAMVNQYGNRLDELMDVVGGDLAAAWEYLDSLRGRGSAAPETPAA